MGELYGIIILGSYLIDKLEFAGICVMDVITHYDLLVDENNDPFRDPPPLQEYMNGWDGELFLESLELSNNKNVLEIGIGTGRIAVKVAPYCMQLTVIDISPKTIERAKENLKDCSMVFGEISIPVNCIQYGATFTAILPVPIPISRTILLSESSSDSKNRSPSHPFIYSCSGGGSRKGSLFSSTNKS